MCNLGEGIYIRGIEAGRKAGREEVRNRLLTSVEQGQLSEELAASILGVSLEEFENIRHDNMVSSLS